MTDAAVTVHGLTKVFSIPFRRQAVVAVRDLDLQVGAGEVYGLLGPNGSSLARLYRDKYQHHACASEFYAKAAALPGAPSYDKRFSAYELSYCAGRERSLRAIAPALRQRRSGTAADFDRTTEVSRREIEHVAGSANSGRTLNR